MSHYSINHRIVEDRWKEFQESPNASCPRAGKITCTLTQNLFNLFLPSFPTFVMTGGLQLDGTLHDLSSEVLLIPKQSQNKGL